MCFRSRYRAVVIAALAGFAASAAPTFAQKQHSVGESDTEIRIGQTMPYSGPASALATVGRLHSAFFQYVNERGGINGRQIKFISLDDGFSPPKTVEQTRRLVEQEKVLLIFSPYGTATSAAVRKYLNSKKVPQLFVAAGGATWGDHENYPWTMGWLPRYEIESRIHADFLLRNKPDAKIAIIYQNDDFGKELARGLRAGLGGKASSMIVKEVSYEVTDATVDSQVAAMKESGADVLFSYALPRFSAQVVRRAYDIDWKPLIVLNQTAVSVANVLAPAGLEKSKGAYAAAYIKDPSDPAWANDAYMAEFRAWMAKYYPAGDVNDSANLYGYGVAKTMLDVLRRAGADLTHENIMRSAASLDLDVGVLLPGIRVKTGPTDFYPIEQMQLMRFDGNSWRLLGELIDGTKLK